MALHVFSRQPLQTLKYPLMHDEIRVKSSHSVLSSIVLLRYNIEKRNYLVCAGVAFGKSTVFQ